MTGFLILVFWNNRNKSALFIQNKKTDIDEKKHMTAIISSTSINTFEVSQIFFACKWLTWIGVAIWYASIYDF